MSNEPTQANTISDEAWQSLKDRQAKANKRSMFDPAEVKQRLQSKDQSSKSRWS